VKIMYKALLTPYSTVPPLLELEKFFYITNDPLHRLFQTRVDQGFLEPFVAGYQANEKTMVDYVTQLAEEIGLEDIQQILPARTTPPTAREFIQSNLF